MKTVEIDMAAVMAPYNWQLYVMLALCVLIGVIVGLLIADGRKPSGKALIRPAKAGHTPGPAGPLFTEIGPPDRSPGVQSPPYCDGGRLLEADQPLETIEVDGHTLYVLHRGGNASAGSL